MGLLDGLVGRKPKSQPEIETTQPEVKQSQGEIETPTTRAEVSHSEIDTLNETLNNTSEILKDVKLMYAFLINHDQHLIKHDQTNAEYLTEILLQNKIITPDKKPEVKAILTKAITENKPKSEAVKELMEIGITRATAYNYTKTISKDKPDTEAV